MTANPLEKHHTNEASETQLELARKGFKVGLETCRQAIDTMHATGKEAAAEVLRAAGVPVKMEVGHLSAATFTRWTVKGFVVFCE
jgi:hypothetical protein